MARKDFILDLGKFLIGAAWSDGTLTHEEINALKELLFLLPDISGEDWMTLEMYMASPVGETERQRLLCHVLDGIRSSAEKTLVLDTLQKLTGLQSQGSANQTSVLEALRQDIEGKQTGLLAHLTGPLNQAIKKRATYYQGKPTREDRLDDFIQNTIYFQLVSELEARQKTLHLSETQIRKICLAAGLMAHIAWVDNEVCHREKESMTQALRENWGLSQEEAQLISEISHVRIMKGLDLIRLTKGFCGCTTLDERKAFLRCLFAIANAANQTSHQEIEEIRATAKALELPHQEFIDAKLTIARKDRGGL